MEHQATKRVTRGLLSILLAAFLLLGAFVMLINGIMTPSTGQVVLGLVLLVAGVLLAIGGRGALARTSADDASDKKDGPKPEGDAQDGRRDDPMDA